MMERPGAVASRGFYELPDQRRWPLFAANAWVVLLGLLAWWGVWNGQYVFDDLPAIAGSEELLAGDWWGAAFSEDHHPLANRLLSCWTLAMDMRLFGPGPFGPHLTNLLLHLTNGLLVFAVVREALTAPNLAGRFAPARAMRLSLVVTTVWVVHPLAGDAIAYATQRSTLLTSAFLLVAMWSTLRAAGSPRSPLWRTIGVFAVACAMASKEDSVVIPLLLVAWERAVVVPTWAALRTRSGYLLALAATWFVLAFCMALGPSNPTVGYHTVPPATAWQWLMTQSGVLVHYLRLVIVPYPLRGAYDWGVITSLGKAVLPGLVILTLVGLTIRLLATRPWWGFPGALFFLMLAPTSSVMPIITETVAERRMYLPMLTVLVPLVLLVEHLLRAKSARRVGPLLVLAAAIGLGLLSRQRVAAYADAPSFWADAYGKRDPDERGFLAAQILSTHASVLHELGQVEEALALLETLPTFELITGIERGQYALVLQHKGKHAEAVALLRQLASDVPRNGSVVGRFGTAIVAHWNADKGPPDDPRLTEAQQVLERAVQLYPEHAGFWQVLGFVRRTRGDLAGAAEAFRSGTEHTTTRVEPYFSLAELLPGLGRSAEVGALFDRLLAANPGDGQLRVTVGEFLLRQGRGELARPVLQEALRIDPGDARAAELLSRTPTDSRR
jgi:tetratricopeptide (TPR) repeat protein